MPLANFFASGVLHLGAKLGPILWQFPPDFQFDARRIEDFLTLLPHDTARAAAIAQNHDRWMNNRVHLRAETNQPLRHAMEIRHKSFVSKEFIRLLRKYKVALVCADTVEWPRLMDLTADFIYCRLHGSKELYASGYGKKDIETWAARVAAWATGREPADAERVIPHPAPKRAKRDVYLYFDNDAKVRAPVDAKNLIARVNTLLEK
jgi:uncharacterized protein YecE (DUF72 family)